MPGRPVLSEEAEKEEMDERVELRRLDLKIGELRGRRQRLLQDVRGLSDQQKALYDARQPKQDRLEGVHQEHLALGHELGEIRRARDDARRAADRALIELREYRATQPRAEATAHPEQLRREIRELEMRQQTHALPLADENALIDRLRALNRQLGDAQKGQAAQDARTGRLRELEDGWRHQRSELDRLQLELGRVHAEREKRMQSMREQLVEVGRLVADLREKGRQRAEAMARLDACNMEVGGLEREAEKLVRRSRDRRTEARSTVRDYNRGVRESVAGESAYARHADAQLEQLMKRGRVTLGQ